MKKVVIICSALVLSFCLASASGNNFTSNNDGNGDKKYNSLLPRLEDESAAVAGWVDSLYIAARLEEAGLRKNVFFYALKGYEYLLSQNAISNNSLLTICDYSQSSKSKRLYVIDLNNGILLYNTYVSHGKNSGGEFATSFSNKAESHKSSLGFMVTSDTYFGKAGYSMHFNGMENGINNNVRARNIVMHGSDYVNEERIMDGNFIGRSYGCPAVPQALHTDIINAIKNGSCFFAYADDSWYAATSKILKAKFAWPDVSITINVADNNTNDSSDNAVASSVMPQRGSISIKD